MTSPSFAPRKRTSGLLAIRGSEAGSTVAMPLMLRCGRSAVNRGWGLRDKSGGCGRRRPPRPSARRRRHRPLVAQRIAQHRRGRRRRRLAPFARAARHSLSSSDVTVPSWLRSIWSKRFSVPSPHSIRLISPTLVAVEIHQAAVLAGQFGLIQPVVAVAIEFAEAPLHRAGKIDPAGRRRRPEARRIGVGLRRVLLARAAATASAPARPRSSDCAKIYTKSAPEPP